MPYKNHRKSRALFIREAKKLSENEFRKWYKLTARLLPTLERIRKQEVRIPTLYIMGNQDYMFLPFVKKIVKIHSCSTLLTLQKSGHVVNIDQPEQFNNGLLRFLLASD
jgi:pimeloyl-ACP methyl ester carboxylesterase